MKKPLQARILEILRDNPGLTVKELSMFLEMSPKRTRVLIYELKNKGYIEKSGDGYIVTARGERYLSFIEQKIRETPTPHTEPEASLVSISSTDTARDHDEPSRAEASLAIERSVTRLGDLESIIRNVEELASRLRELENRLSIVESKIRDLEKALTIVTSRRIEQHYTIDPPVMTHSEAMARYGSTTMDRLLSENKVVRIGSLIVDKEFYQLFRAKFPIKTVDLDKLTAYERILLEEMRKEALVVLHSGREYRLVD